MVQWGSIKGSINMTWEHSLVYVLKWTVITLLEVLLYLSMDKLSAWKIKSLSFTYIGFPNVVGCVDGTQIKIKAPNKNEGDFINRKGFHALNVQVILVIQWRQLKWIIFFVATGTIDYRKVLKCAVHILMKIAIK